MDKDMARAVASGALTGAGRMALPYAGGFTGDKIASAAANAYNSRKMGKLKARNASADDIADEAKKAIERKRKARIVGSTIGALGGMALNKPVSNKISDLRWRYRMNKIAKRQEKYEPSQDT